MSGGSGLVVWVRMANNARRRRDGRALVAWQRQKVACMRCTAHARLGALCALPRVCATRRRRGAVRSGVRPCRALNSKYSRKSQSSLGTVIGHSEDPCRRLRVSASLDLHTVSLPGSSVCVEKDTYPARLCARAPIRATHCHTDAYDEWRASVVLGMAIEAS